MIYRRPPPTKGTKLRLNRIAIAATLAAALASPNTASATGMEPQAATPHASTAAAQPDSGASSSAGSTTAAVPTRAALRVPAIARGSFALVKANSAYSRPLVARGASSKMLVAKGRHLSLWRAKGTSAYKALVTAARNDGVAPASTRGEWVTDSAACSSALDVLTVCATVQKLMGANGTYSQPRLVVNATRTATTSTKFLWLIPTTTTWKLCDNQIGIVRAGVLRNHPKSLTHVNLPSYFALPSDGTSRVEPLLREQLAFQLIRATWCAVGGMDIVGTDLTFVNT